MYYLQSRYYNPETGRFINADALVSTGQGFLGNNMFAYCLNNSVNFVDIRGNTPSAAGWWGAGMGWLPVVDGPIPVGEVIYIGGFFLLVIYDWATTENVTIEPPSYDPDQTEEKTKPVSPPSQPSKKVSSPTVSSANSPKPPKKNNNWLSFCKDFVAGTTYNKNGVRVDYEYNSNRTGNVHIHKDGQKYYYDTQGYLRTGLSNLDPLATTSIQRLLRDKAIMQALLKGVEIIQKLGGYR